MIEKIHLKNFKAFRETDLELRDLNLLSGMNSVGKSTVLQSLLALRQSYLAAGRPDNAIFPLQLNGEYIELGNADDVFYQASSRETTDNVMEIGLTDTFGEHKWKYDKPLDQDFFAVADFDGNALTLDSALFSDEGNFQYLQAERVGPRVFAKMDDRRVEKHDIGKAGEFAVQYLDYLHVGDDTRPSYTITETDLLFDREEDNDPGILAQVIKWMGTISPNTDLRPLTQRELSISRLMVNGHRATNVGFGISYALPILVAILSAKTGDLILLENPEAHLHPQGQARMGELMARAASIGIQIICETHSDHVLNGIRYAAKVEDESDKFTINADQIVIHHFSIEEGNRQHYRIEVDEDGDLKPWPEGFFDQIEKMLLKLI